MHRVVIEDIGSSDEEEGTSSSDGGGGRINVVAAPSALLSSSASEPRAPAAPATKQIGSSKILIMDEDEDAPAASVISAPADWDAPATEWPQSAAAPTPLPTPAPASAPISSNDAAVAAAVSAAKAAAVKETAMAATTAAAALSTADSNYPHPTPHSLDALASSKLDDPTTSSRAERRARAATAAAVQKRSAVSPVAKGGAAARKGAGITPAKFAAEWRKHRKTSSQLFAFLKTFDHNNLHTLLKSSLDGDFITDLCKVISSHCIPEQFPVITLLSSLAKADRFEMTAMMMDEPELLILKKAFSANAGGAAVATVERVARLYSN
jgi:hypothetical protein